MICNPGVRICEEKRYKIEYDIQYGMDLASGTPESEGTAGKTVKTVFSVMRNTYTFTVTTKSGSEIPFEVVETANGAMKKIEITFLMPAEDVIITGTVSPSGPVIIS